MTLHYVAPHRNNFTYATLLIKDLNKPTSDLNERFSYRLFHLDLPIDTAPQGLVIATAAHRAGSPWQSRIGSISNRCGSHRQQQRPRRKAAAAATWLALLSVRDIDRTIAFHRPLSMAWCVGAWKSNCR